MKKLITILAIMIIVVGSVFATSPEVDTATQKMTLLSVVDMTDVAFTLQGKLSSGKAMDATTDEVFKDATKTETALAGTTLTAKSIADNDIVAEFQIVQGATCRYKGTVTFTVTVGALTQQAPIADGETAATVSGAISDMTATGAATYSGKQGGATKTLTNKITNTVTTANSVVTSKYNGKVAEGQGICTFKATWLQDDTLPNGTYKADITVAISAS